MGNSSSKDGRGEHAPRHAGNIEPMPSGTAPQQQQQTPQQVATERLVTQIYGTRSRNGSNSARGSRHDLSFLGLGSRERGEEQQAPERPRETKQEREARKAEKERQARVKERERSMREEGVDGGYLVTLGVYTGVEDFSKSVVRQLQIERRLAPFWKGLNDHSDSWAEHQLVAAARGLPIPAPDEIPPDMVRSASGTSNNARGSDFNLNSLTVSIGSRSQSYQSDRSTSLSASHPAFSNSGSATPTHAGSSTGQLFRGRAKTLASLATGSKSHSPDLTPQETRYPHDPYVNGLPIEAYLYREVTECPICFMYYPPYLNKTRCCDQPICSECFVQIKRPDPHPPEHEQPGQERPPEEEAELLVSEIASCPFCVTPEFGVTYEAPPFKRGLAYANASSPNPFRNMTSAASSQTSLPATGNRRRTTSLSANAPSVITTDRVRPDWAKKLADARAHTLRRSAAATALHNAAYVLGGNATGELPVRSLAFGRRRRTLFGDSPNASGSGTPREGAEGGELYSGRPGGRRNRVEDLEDLMMMEAIRLSLAAEDDRKQKEDKEIRKEAKKKAKDAKKEAKAAEKQAKKNGVSGSSLYPTGTNDSVSTWATTSMARSTSNLGQQPSIPEEDFHGKGKAPAQDFAGFIPLSDPSSTLNTEIARERKSGSHSPPTTRTVSDSQRHLEESRANIQPSTSNPIAVPGARHHQRQASNASSIASSYVESAPGSFRDTSNIPSASGSGLDLSNNNSTAGTPSMEPMLNFRSLAAMIGEEDKGHGNEHIEHAPPAPESQTPAPPLPPVPAFSLEPNRKRGDSGESSASSPPPIYVEESPNEPNPPGIDGNVDGDQITPAPQRRLVSDVDQKHAGINVLNGGHTHEATQ